ncbi:hypothetical protein [Klebsiella pneumoniae]|uniref:hypothetical protein n=1 Tax=Klebsiella pneumoniae TaxID=573 RepID=UPI001F3B1B82|nr:hypothetical protein [Klebsiella pneumoniae]MCF1868386.1 hypothetical protein [Klebsiella pneumoniae]
MRKLSLIIFLLFTFNYTAIATSTPLPERKNIHQATQTDIKEEKNIYENNKDTNTLLSLLDTQKKEIEIIRSDIHSIKNSSGMNFAIWIGILLASITVILTVLGIAMAICSFFGYKKIMSSAKDVATSISTTEATKITKSLAPTVTKNVLLKLIDEGKFDEIIENAVEEVTYRGIQFSPEETNQDEEKIL